MRDTLDKIRAMWRQILYPKGLRDPKNLPFAVIHVITLVECLRPLFLILMASLTSGIWLRVFLTMINILAIAIACNIWNRKGHTRSAGIIFLLYYDVSLFFSAWTGGGVRSSAMATLIIVTFWAGFILSPALAAGVAVFNMASGLVLAWMAERGWLPPPTLVHTEASFWVNTMFNIALLFVTQQAINKIVAKNLMLKTKALAKEQKAKEEVMRLSKLRDEFLVNLSHELRTPLTSIMGWAELLQQDLLDDETKAQAFDIIANNVKSQVQLIDDLLSLSRAVNAEMPMPLQDTPVPSLVQDVLKILKPSAAKKNISFEVIVTESDAVARANAERLRQVMWNILVNAIKFSGDGGTVTVDIDSDETRVNVRIQDQGIGISAQYLPHVFERFSQQDYSLTRDFGGLGIGMALAKEYIELMGGRIRAESKGTRRGATFTVSLPRAPQGH